MDSDERRSQIVGPSPLQLLGLVTIRKERGSHWMAPDSEIDLFLKRFYPSK